MTIRPTTALDQLLKNGFLALSQGRIARASECCRQALQRQPKLVPAHFLLGLVALEAQQRKTAFSAFRTVTHLEPGHAAAWAHLARLFMGEGQVNRADKALARAATHVGNEPVVCDLMATVYSLMGEYGEASQWFEKAVAGQPNHPPYLLNLANNLIYQGRADRANPLFRKILAIQPDSPQAHWSLAASRRARDDRHIDQMADLASGEHLQPRARAFYFYAMGKELEDLELWERAFEAFSTGARIRRATVEYDEAAEIEMFDFLGDNFDGRQQLVAPPAPADGPIFVLGQPRTGTTLVERIISSHTQVHAAGELQQFGLALRRLSNYSDPRRFTAQLFAAAQKLEPRKIGSLYLETVRRMRGDTPRFVDKLPQNYLMVPLILAALPQARIVHVVREPMDACFASFKQLFADAYLHSYDQQEMARHHARYRHLMALWHERFPGRIHDIAYEATVGQLENEARHLLAWLELPWQDRCLEFYRQDGAVATASAVQVREPAHSRSIGRWRRYEKQLEPMREQLSQCGIETDSNDHAAMAKATDPSGS